MPVNLLVSIFEDSSIVHRVQNGELYNAMSSRGSGAAAVLMQEWHENL